LSPSSESREARLEPGDRLVLYTDGITETVNQAGKLFGEDRFQILIGELRDLPPAEMVREIFQYTRLYSGSHRASLPDDFTLLVVEYRGPDYVNSDLPRHGETAGERAISR
jgi:sigma-B regulation protein RsbU (phosphoserine phosphatase)